MTAANQPDAAPGAIALVGAGEYTDAMNETDRALLETLGGAGAARVALLPLASGLEAGGPTRWNAMGLRHFSNLGVQDIRPTGVVDRASAADPAQIALLRDANFFYFSGGNPQYLIETLRGSPAWEAISQAHQQGAVLAGCSAGAMALGGRIRPFRLAQRAGGPVWTEALGLLPQIIIFPHFDRMAVFVGRDLFDQMLSSIPAGFIALGIDEDTALVRLMQNSAPDADGKARWRAMGRQTVTRFAPGQPPKTLHSGEELWL